MQLKPIPVLDNFQKYFDKYSIVVNFCGFEIVSSDNNIYEISLKAALEGMKIFQKRLEHRHARYNKNYKKNRSNFFHIETYNNKKITGQLISTFELLVQKFNELELLEEVYGEYPYKSTMKSLKDDDSAKGLINALLDPPYPIDLKNYKRVKSNKIHDFLKYFLEVTLNFTSYDDLEDFDIYSWSTNWSNYFNAGKEWWGAYYWTIYHKKLKKVVILAASSSD